MKRVIVFVLAVALIAGGVIGGLSLKDQPGKITISGFNWYENRSQNEIESANQFAQERLENKYHVFVNGIMVDIGYEWDGAFYVPIRTVCESLNWTVNWIPELEVIQLLKDDDEAFVEIENLFGKAYVELNRLENLLRLQEVQVHGANIEISSNDSQIESISFNGLKKTAFYINEMKMTDRAVIYQGENLLPARIFAMCMGGIFRYDAEKGVARIAYQQIDCLFIDGQAYASLEELLKAIDLEDRKFTFEFLAASNEKDLFPVISKGPNDKVIALTFDDYLGDKVYELLDVLDDCEVKATFFIIGNSIHNYSDILSEIVRRGHLPANHTWDHLNCHTLTDDEVRAQLISTQLEIQKYGGDSVFFRPPGGYYDHNMQKIAQDIGLQTVLWSVNSTDANLSNSAGDIEKVVTRWASPGAIIVMHLNRESTIQAIPGIIKDLRSKGYRFVTISELKELTEEETAR